MKAQPFVVTPKDYDPALNVLGIRVTVLASNTATQAYEITRQQGEKATVADDLCERHLSQENDAGSTQTVAASLP